MSRNKFARECGKQFNHIGLLNDTDVVRLIGFADDGEDYYYKVMYPSLTGGEPKILYSSMVGPFASLKGHYRRYKQLERQFTDVWNAPPQKEFVEENI